MLPEGYETQSQKIGKKFERDCQKTNRYHNLTWVMERLYFLVLANTILFQKGIYWIDSLDVL